MSEQLSPEEKVVSNKLETIGQAQEKAEEGARVIQERYPGSYMMWINARILRVYSKEHKIVATIHVETVQ